MSDKQKAPNVPAGRRVQTTINLPFKVVFFERIYSGAPRWWSSEWLKHFRRPSGAGGYCLEREDEVKKHLQLSHNPKCLFTNVDRKPDENDPSQIKPSDVSFLIACTNYNCSLRTWESVNFGSNKLSSVKSVSDFAMFEDLEAAERKDFSARITPELHRVSLAKDLPVEKNQLMEKCPNCQTAKMVSGITPIRNKWVYVLKGSDGTLQPHTEIYLESAAQGDMYQDFKNGAFNPSNKKKYPGFFPIEKADGELWHFFLSPVRLGPKSISMLTKSSEANHDWAQNALDADEKSLDEMQKQGEYPMLIETGWDPTRQPWSTVESRKFSKGQVKTLTEPVALVDPFSWAGQASDLDYLPIAAARQTLLDNPEEQAKAFIAASLAPAKGEKQDENNIEQTDPWDLKGQTMDVPPEYASSGNIAQAWIDRYKQALQYLEKETRAACSRIIYAVRFSQAHRIVELACQENTGDPDALAFGMIHWCHILREMLVCDPGTAFIAWLTKSRTAIDWIPQQIGTDKYNKSDPRAQAIGQGLPAMVLSYLTPVLLRETDKPEDVFRHRLEEIDIEVPMDWAKAILTPDTTKPIADLTFSIPEKYLHHYIHHFPKEIHVDQFHALNGAKNWQARIMGISKLKDLLRVAALLRCVFEWGEEYKGPDTTWGYTSNIAEKVETGVKLAEFWVEQGKLLIEEGFGKELEHAAEEIAKRGTTNIYGELVKKKLLKATNALRAMKGLEAGEKLLSGPIGFLMGGAELVLQTHESVEAWENGDPNAAMAHQIKALAGGLMAVIGIGETLAIIGVAGEMAWLGPVGWIAAGLMLIGEIYLAYGSKTDYELFAEYCFLGTQAGAGGEEGGEEKSNKVWMEDMSWAQLAEPKYGRLALLRLASTFSVWIGYHPLAPGEGPWWQIKAKFVPAGAYFEVEEDFWDVRFKGSGLAVDRPRVTQKAKIWADGKLQMGPPPRPDGKPQQGDATNCDVRVKHYTNGTVFNVKIVPDSQYLNMVNWDDLKYEWSVRVRLVFDGVDAHGFATDGAGESGHKSAPKLITLPAKGWVKNQHGSISSEVGTSE
jgi:hypothetical protein